MEIYELSIDWNADENGPDRIATLRSQEASGMASRSFVLRLNSGRDVTVNYGVAPGSDGPDSIRIVVAPSSDGDLPAIRDAVSRLLGIEDESIISGWSVIPPLGSD